MSSFRKQLGQSGEELAMQFLKSKGFKILDQNLRFKFGEIDIVAEDKEDIVLVEVKTKSGVEFGQPLEEVDYFKKRKLQRLAQALSQKYPDRNIRIDVVGVKLGAVSCYPDASIEHIKGAVEF